MILYKKGADTRQWLEKHRFKNKSIGFVPTMGALHPGHLSLVQASRAENELTVCSIFVNPTQFNDPSDYEKYPVTIDEDIRMLEEAGCDLLFLPGIKEIYPEGLPTGEHYELGELETLLEGRFRPGHYQGVCMVVKRLLETVDPRRLYLGQKDYQQCMVIARLVEEMGWKEKTDIIVCPTLREADGLAMSSRNRRLSPVERALAPTLFRVLSDIREKIHAGSTVELLNTAMERLTQAGFRTDYITVADAHTLHPVTVWDGQRPVVALVAAFLGETRLIDNIIIKE